MQITVKTAKGHQFAVDVAAGSDGEISIPDLKTAIVERAPASCSFKSDGFWKMNILAGFFRAESFFFRLDEML